MVSAGYLSNTGKVFGCCEDFSCVKAASNVSGCFGVNNELKQLC